MSDHRHALDWLAIGFGGFAAYSFWQGVALAVTIIAGLLSIILGAMRVHDRLRYGPVRRGE